MYKKIVVMALTLGLGFGVYAQKAETPKLTNEQKTAQKSADPKKKDEESRRKLEESRKMLEESGKASVIEQQNSLLKAIFTYVEATNVKATNAASNDVKNKDVKKKNAKNEDLDDKKDQLIQLYKDLTKGKATTASFFGIADSLFEKKTTDKLGASFHFIDTTYEFTTYKFTYDSHPTEIKAIDSVVDKKNNVVPSAIKITTMPFDTRTEINGIVKKYDVTTTWHIEHKKAKGKPNVKLVNVSIIEKPHTKQELAMLKKDAEDNIKKVLEVLPSPIDGVQNVELGKDPVMVEVNPTTAQVSVTSLPAYTATKKFVAPADETHLYNGDEVVTYTYKPILTITTNANYSAKVEEVKDYEIKQHEPPTAPEREVAETTIQNYVEKMNKYVASRDSQTRTELEALFVNTANTETVAVSKLNRKKINTYAPAIYFARLKGRSLEITLGDLTKEDDNHLTWTVEQKFESKTYKDITTKKITLRYDADTNSCLIEKIDVIKTEQWKK